MAQTATSRNPHGFTGKQLDALENGPSPEDVYEDDADDPEEDMQEAFEAKLVEDIQALVAGELDPEEFHVEHGCPNHFRSFEEAGVLTSDKGFCFDWHGHRVYVTVQVQ
jgi:hypothetical protein